MLPFQRLKLRAMAKVFGRRFQRRLAAFDAARAA